LDYAEITAYGYRIVCAAAQRTKWLEPAPKNSKHTPATFFPKLFNTGSKISLTGDRQFGKEEN
jgi:hypothetical protein